MACNDMFVFSGVQASASLARTASAQVQFVKLAVRTFVIDVELAANFVKELEIIQPLLVRIGRVWRST